MSCPICKKATHQDFKPFCSKHCKNIDLYKWLNNEYIIQQPISEEDLEESYNDSSNTNNNQDQQ